MYICVEPSTEIETGKSFPEIGKTRLGKSFPDGGSTRKVKKIYLYSTHSVFIICIKIT